MQVVYAFSSNFLFKSKPLLVGLPKTIDTIDPKDWTKNYCSFKLLVNDQKFQTSHFIAIMINRTIERSSHFCFLI